MTVSVHRFDSSETNNLGDLVAVLSTPSTLNEGVVNDFTATFKCQIASEYQIPG